MRDNQDGHEKNDIEEFIQALTAAQTSLRAYVLASVGNWSDASDVLQKTNLAIWKNAPQYRSDLEFMPWAVTIAKYQILSYCRDRSRDRHVYPEDVAALMLETAHKELPDPDGRQEALRHCLEKLPSKYNEVLRLRYYDEMPVSQMASSLHRTEDSIKSVLVRIRRKLQECIQSRMNSSTTQ